MLKRGRRLTDSFDYNELKHGNRFNQMLQLKKITNGEQRHVKTKKFPVAAQKVRSIMRLANMPNYAVKKVSTHRD